MSEIVNDDSRSRFARIISLPDEQINLAEAALLIAAEEYARLDIAHYLQKLDLLGDMARERAVGAQNAIDMISAINSTLYDTLGFRGNHENYYDPRNSFLNQVIDRRTGIPITLAIVYIEVARRIGFAVYGVGLPRHFIAKHLSDKEEIFIDPFNEGRILGEASINEMLDEISGGRLSLQPEYLLASTNRQILLRMLSNLLAIYAGSGDYSRSLAAIERILLIHPDSPPHVRDAGLLLAALDRQTEALAELERYLLLAPDAADSDDIKKQITTIRQSLARLN